MPSQKKRIVFIGCGPTTLGATYRIRELLEARSLTPDEVEVVVLEKEAVPGGLARSITDEKGFSWDLGVHVSGKSSYACFTRCLDEAVGGSGDDVWNYKTRCVKADMRHIFGGTGEDGTATYVPYPVQHAIPLFPPAIRDQCMQELRELQETKFDGPPKDFNEWTHRAFGKTMQDIFVRPYNKKVWTVWLEEMNSNWVGDRVATIDLKHLEEVAKKDRQELRSAGEDLGWGPNALFRYPHHLRGVGETWQLVYEKQPSEWFHFNEEVFGVDTDKKQVRTMNTLTKAESHFDYDYLVSTMPITLLGKLTTLLPAIRLSHSKVVLVGLGLTKPRSAWADKMTWVYYPCEQQAFYRATFLSNFNAIMTPDNDKYWSVLVECGFKPDETINKETVVEAVIEGLISRTVFERRDQVVDVFFMVLPYGYPIPTVNRDAELASTHKVLEGKDIYSRGRFGGWKYEVANQDHSFCQGYQLTQRLLEEGTEPVYNKGP